MNENTKTVAGQARSIAFAAMFTYIVYRVGKFFFRLVLALGSWIRNEFTN